MTSIKEQMNKAFGVNNKNTLTLSVEDELKNINMMRELRDLGKNYRERHVNDLDAKKLIETMIMGSTAVQLEEIFLRQIWNRQMSDEQREGNTKYRNGIGFSGVDAKIASSIVQQINNGYSLSVKQTNVVRKILLKYWKQYLDTY